MSETSFLKKRANLSEFFIANFEEIISSFLLFGVFVVVLANVASRAIANASIVWAEEVSGILFIWSVYIGIAAAVKQGSLISIELVTERLPKGVQKSLAILTNVVLVLLMAFLIYQGSRMAINFASDKLPMSNLSIGYMYYSLPVGGILILVRLVENLVKSIKN